MPHLTLTLPLPIPTFHLVLKIHILCSCLFGDHIFEIHMYYSMTYHLLLLMAVKSIIYIYNGILYTFR